MFQLKERKEEKLHPSSPFGCICALNRLDDAHPHRWGLVFFTESTESNANLVEKYIHRGTQKYIYLLSGHPLAQSSGHINVSITTLTKIENRRGGQKGKKQPIFRTFTFTLIELGKHYRFWLGELRDLTYILSKTNICILFHSQLMNYLERIPWSSDPTCHHLFYFTVEALNIQLQKSLVYKISSGTSKG